MDIPPNNKKNVGKYPGHNHGNSSQRTLMSAFDFSSKHGDDEEISFKEKRFLVVDDLAGMRSSMRTIITTFGGVAIDMAANAADALGKMERTTYDIILCDYDLGSGKDGQVMMEEAKKRKLLKNSSIFMMVTAERSYERVIGAAEQAPDDYLLKPFVGETLQLRLSRVIRKKRFFVPILDLMDQQD